VKPEGTKLQSAIKKPPTTMAQTPANILVVEDDKNVAAVLEARLESFGYNVCDIAATGLGAIESAIEHQPDLILMDILLEGDMNGIEAADNINNHFDVPIIFLSCLNDPAVLESAVETNPYGYIVKPYDNAALKSAIEITLVKYRAEKDREKLIDQLKRALDEVKRLSGLLPICASCKRIRDDEGGWHQIEDYIAEHSEADFSHGICPQCAHKLYPDVYPEEELP
jgi:CheY-like chemotaxis protein